ncbi:hypothetical protein [Paenisporosarcina sp. NPDC076898]|uniref:hypothetical protein n=1 Tax=unclassified Paenisporosarcina TaxID=2642018 RepID=UPI003D05394C
MKYIIILLISSSLLLPGCSKRTDTERVHEDLIDMIAINDVYLYYSEEETKSFNQSEIDILIGEVLFTVKGNEKGGYKPKNGDATFLDVGTKIYSVVGYSSIERVYANGKLYGPYSFLQKH